MKNLNIIFAFILILANGCYSEENQNYLLNKNEKNICKTLQIDSTIVKEIRSLNDKKIEPFHYSLSKIFKGGKEIELYPIYLKGVVFSEDNSKSYDLVFNLKEGFKKKGYSIFLLENNFDIDNKQDKIGILKTSNKYSVLSQIQTNGINYDISNDSLITIIKKFDQKYTLDLIGASGDWCEFIIKTEPKDWKLFATEVYNICPDVVDQGTGTIEQLAKEMKLSKRLYLWWD